jgi:hypothetical protein
MSSAPPDPPDVPDVPDVPDALDLPDLPRLFGDDDAVGEAMRAARADVPDARQLTLLAASLGPILPPVGAAPGPGEGGDGGGGGEGGFGGEGAGVPLPPEALVPLGSLPMTPLFSGKLAAVLVAAGLAVGVPFVYQYQATRPEPPRVVAADSSASLTMPALPQPHEEATPVATTSTSPVLASAVVSARAPRPGTSTTEVVDDGAPKETEGELLRRAHDALSGDPAKALALTEEHTKRFPGGMLGQERELVAIEALIKLGRIGQARVRGASFLQRFPTSAHARRVRTLVPGLEGMGEEEK